MEEVTETLTRGPARVEIDVNAVTPEGYIRTRQGNTSRPVTLYEEVTVFEPEDGIAGRATVASIDNARGLLYLDVDWASMDDDYASPAPVVRSRPVSATSTPASRTSSSYTRPVRIVTTTRMTRTVGSFGGRASYGLAARGTFTTGGGSTVQPMMRQGFR